MKKALCKPCSLGLIAAGMKVKQLPGKAEKITCVECGRRRFGAEYEVTEKNGGRTDEGV